MKKLFYLLSIIAVLCIATSSFAAGDKNKEGKQKNKESIQQMSKPSYYQPYNTPNSKKKHAKDYNSDWDIKTDDVKKKNKK